MSDERKVAAATLRHESRMVRSYLEALESTRPTRGRGRTPDSITKRSHEIDASLEEAVPMGRLNLPEERMNLRDEPQALDAKVDLIALEAEFVAVAYSYSERRGISYAAWREAGVDVAVLRKAGVTRSM